MTEEDRAIILRRANENLQTDIQNHAIKYGWENTAKVLRQVVFVHVGWNSAFTELDNALRTIERNFDNSCRPDLERDLLAQRERDRSGDHINLPDGKVSDHFS